MRPALNDSTFAAKSRKPQKYLQARNTGTACLISSLASSAPPSPTCSPRKTSVTDCKKWIALTDEQRVDSLQKMRTQRKVPSSSASAVRRFFSRFSFFIKPRVIENLTSMRANGFFPFSYGLNQ